MSLGLSKQAFKINPKNSASSSVVVFVTPKNNPNIEAVLKISTESPGDDNSLDVERELYSLVKTKLQKWTPHILAAIDTGKARDTEVFLMKNSKKQWERDLYKEWLTLRTESIEQKVRYEGKSWSAFLKTLPSSVNTSDMFSLGVYLYEKDARWKREFRHMHFIMTEKLAGERLDDFFIARKSSSDSLVRVIALQLAQALSVMALHKIMHNDLHFGNVFIKTHNKVKTITYNYPKKCVLKTKYELMIYDLDRGYMEGGTSNTGLDNSVLCERYGECSKYIAKADWYTALTYLYRYSKNKTIRDSMNGMYQEVSDPPVVGKDALHGHPCACQKVDPKKSRCLKCAPKSLAKLISPKTYFMRNIEQK